MRRRQLERAGPGRRAVTLAGTGAWQAGRADVCLRWALWSSVGALLLVTAAGAQPVAGPRALALVPSGSITETLTDNYRLSGVNPQSDAITRLTAGVSLRSEAGLLRGYLDYSLSSLVYARHGERNELQNGLSSNLIADLLEGRMKVVVKAGISQRAVSAFGAQPAGNGLSNDNSTELRTLRITPSLQGPLGPGLRYSGSLGYSISDTSNSNTGNSRATTAKLRLEPASPGRLGWSVDGSHVRSSFKLGRVNEDDRLVGNLNLPLDDFDLKLNGNAGVEFTDQASARRQRYQTWGVGLVWTPSPRARLAGELDRRFFGQSHSLSFEYRTPLTVWRLSDSRNLTTGDGQTGAAGRGTAFDHYFALFRSREPDDVKRAALVDSFLKLNKIDPDAGAPPGFLRSSATLDNRFDFSVAMLGPRSTALLTLTRSRTRRLDLVLGAQDDLANANEVRQTGVSLDLSHRLTPQSSLGLVLNQRQSRGTLASQDSRQRQASLLHTSQLSAESTLAVGARRALYKTGASAYAESALFATYGIRF